MRDMERVRGKQRRVEHEKILVRLTLGRRVLGPTLIGIGEQVQP